MHKPLKDLIPSCLMEQLQRDVVQSLGLKYIPTVSYAKILRNTYSDVHIVHIDPKHLNLHVYVKIPHANPSSIPIVQERLATEFKIMQQLHNHASTRTNALFCHVAKPLGYYPDHLAIATFKASSQTLRQHYRSAARLIYNNHSRDMLVKEVENCGLWLKTFQQCTACGTGAFDDKKLISYLKTRLQELTEKSNLYFSQSLAEKIIAQITHLSHSIDPQTHKISGRHNDFASHNILTDKGKIWVIDFSMYDTESSTYDPAYFWLELEMLKLDPSYSRQFLDFLQNVFIESYGSISTESHSFNLVRCQYSINRISTLHSDAQIPTPDTLYRRSVVKACMAWIKYFAHHSETKLRQ